MSSHEDNVRRHRDTLEAFNRRDLDGLTTGYAESITSTDHAQQQTMKSRDGIRAWNQAWLDAFSDGRVEDIECMGMGDWTVARFVGRGTNDVMRTLRTIRRTATEKGTP
jgi:ketosteroid isomerase-like protein